VGYNIFSFFNQRFLIELFYNRYITGIILKLGGQTTKVLDKGSVEYIGPYGLEKGLWNISNNIAKLSTGVITSYALYILIGLIIYLLFYSYINNSIIILLLVISLSLVLLSNNKSTDLTSVLLKS
jgi:NADH-ubiquinone oxidoreductase chain 5